MQIWGLKSLKAHQQTACCDINTFYEVHYEVTVHFRAIYVFTMKLAVGCMALLTRARCGFGLIKAIVGNGKTTRRKTQKTTKRDRTSAPNHRKEAKLTLLYPRGLGCSFPSVPAAVTNCAVLYIKNVHVAVD